MRAVDTSVAVAAFGAWHQLNDQARTVLDEGAAVAMHVVLETYSVLTGFPPPYRAPPALVDEWLNDRFAEILAPPDTQQQRTMISRLASAGRIGGSVHDGLIALTTLLAGRVLVTADERAVPVYDLLGVEWQRLESVP